MAEPEQGKQEIATLAGGCFWCLETVFDELAGVGSVKSGYAGGHTSNPTYREVCTGHTGHAEVVQVAFEPSTISYDDLLRNDVELPWGAFVVNLGILRVDYTLSPRMTIRSLSQYNSSTRQFSTSIRYNFIYRPGSDLYIVYDGLQGNLPGRPDLRNQQLVLKLTYLLSR